MTAPFTFHWQGLKRYTLIGKGVLAHRCSLQPNRRPGSIYNLKVLRLSWLGWKNRLTTFRLQREISEYDEEPLMAIIPGATLAEFWQTVAVFEQVLLVISGFVLVAGLLGMLTTLLSTLNERRREMAILRAVGAHPYHILLLFVLETGFVILAGYLVGVVGLYALLAVVRPVLLQTYGINITLSPPDTQQWLLFVLVLVLGILVSSDSWTYRLSPFIEGWLVNKSLSV